MSCLTKLITRPVNNCINLLTIGTIADVNTLVGVWFNNTATDRLDCLTTTTSGIGEVIVDISGLELIPNTTYSIQVTTMAGWIYEITIDGNTTNAILMPVEIINGATAGDVTLVEA